MQSRRTAVAAGVAGGVLVSFALFLVVSPDDERLVLVVNNLVQMLSALGSAVVCAVVAARCSGRRRAGWGFVALALAGWGLGQAYWSWSEIVAQREAPFPSPADVGFLVFPVAAATGIVLFQTGAGRAKLRAASDGLIVCASLFIISWSAVLGPVHEAGAEDAFGFLVAIAYPVGDIVVVALAMLLLIRLSGDRLPMALLAAGLIAMGVADSGFVYLSTAGTYHTGSVIDLGWVAAFLLCAVGADSRPTPDRVSDSTTVSTPGVLLPLIPLGVGLVVLFVESWRGRLDRPMIVAGTVLITLILRRQALVLSQNTALVTTVRKAEERLRHQAFHDPLTGLANRLLFRDRLEHAAELRHRDRGQLALLFLDLDDFKLVNDRLGHAAGDEVLVGVAERLRACLRAGDTVGRLGGDEFAVLLEDDSEDPRLLAARIVAALQTPFRVDGREVVVAGSVGVAALTVAGPVAAVADRLLQQADTAMYAAKHSAKGSYVLFEDGMQMDGLDAPVDRPDEATVSH
jgi:diguanylate cyclase (GGDEF)-like protein